jgi:hypothetical protein
MSVQTLSDHEEIPSNDHGVVGQEEDDDMSVHTLSDGDNLSSNDDFMIYDDEFYDGFDDGFDDDTAPGAKDSHLDHSRESFTNMIDSSLTEEQNLLNFVTFVGTSTTELPVEIGEWALDRVIKFLDWSFYGAQHPEFGTLIPWHGGS